VKRREPEVRSSPRKRGPSSFSAERPSWIPACAGMNGMKRREVITLLGGAAAAWPLAARAQQGEPMRRIGVLMSTAADDPEGQARIAAFQQGLQQFGWTIGRADRQPLADRRLRTYSQICGGAGRALARCHPGHWQRRGRTVATGDPHGTDRVRDCPRPGWRRLRR
jgi:hypothetical protein